MKLLRIFLCLFLTTFAHTFGEETSSTNQVFSTERLPKKPANLSNQISNKKPQRFAFFPLAGYLPDTGLTGAVTFIAFLNPLRKSHEKPDSVSILAAGSVKKQFTLNILPEIYFRSDRFLLSGTFAALKWPAYYYGIGSGQNHEIRVAYRASGILYDGNFFFDFLKGEGFSFMAGPSIRIGFEKNVFEQPEKMSDGRLFYNGIRERAFFFGLGFAFLIDQRSSVFWPDSGYYLKYRFLTDQRAWGSMFVFTDHLFDFRIFRRVRKVILAFQGEVRFMSGEPYFRYMAFPTIRAYEEGRTRGRFQIQTKNELRFPLYKRFRGTVFIDTALPARSIEYFSLHKILVSVGAGIRFALNPDDIVNIRLDVAYNPEGFNVELLALEKF